jgi:hypothetical protein
MAAYVKALVSIGGAAILAGQAIAQPPPLDPLSMRLLVAHNSERLRMGVVPLQWDAALAAAALSYGPALASLGRLQHSPKESRPGQRENLWMGTSGAYSPEQMVSTWLAEKRFFHPGVFPNVSSTGNWLDVAHYTTLVWPTTTRVGCAVYRSGAFDYLICRYSPPGNIDGRPLLLPRQVDRG